MFTLARFPRALPWAVALRPFGATVWGRAIPWLAVLIVAIAWTGLEAADQPAAKDRRAAAKAQPAAKADARLAPGIGDIPATLDQALAKAMENHPDIVAARAKLQLAEAELNRTRMEVARKVVAAWNDRQAQEQTAKIVRQHLESGTGGTTPDAMIAAQAALAQTQAELLYLTGQALPAVARSTQTAATAPPPQAPTGPIPEKIRQALNSPTQMDFYEEPLFHVLDYLKDYHKIEIQVDSKALEGDGIVAKEKISVSTKGVPLSAALELLEDQHPPMKFVVRDYGILVTTRPRAQEEGFYPAIEFARLGEGGEAAAPSEHPQSAGPRTNLPGTSLKARLKSPAAARDPFAR